MKRLLILILLIIFSLPAMGQYDLFGQYNNPFSVWGSKTKTPAGGNYVQRAWDFFNAVTAKGKTLTDAQKRWYNDSLFVPGIAHGYIGTTRACDSLVALYSFSLRWAGDSTVANMNLLDPTGSYNCIHYGGVTYTDSGVVGNGTTGYLNTFFNPISDSSIAKLYSSGLGIYSKSDVNALQYDMGAQGSYWTILISRYGGNFYHTNNVSGSHNSVAVSNSKGMFLNIRSGVLTKAYQNGTEIDAVNRAPTGRTNLNYFILAYNNAGSAELYSTRVMPFASITSGLSAEKSKYLSDDLNNALKGAGYNVY